MSTYAVSPRSPRQDYLEQTHFQDLKVDTSKIQEVAEKEEAPKKPLSSRVDELSQGIIVETYAPYDANFTLKDGSGKKVAEEVHIKALESFCRILGSETSISFKDEFIGKAIYELLLLPTGHELVEAIAKCDMKVHIRASSKKSSQKTYDGYHQVVLARTGAKNVLRDQGKGSFTIGNLTSVEELAHEFIHCMQKCYSAEELKRTDNISNAYSWTGAEEMGAIKGHHNLPLVSASGSPFTENQISKEMGLFPRVYHRVFEGYKPSTEEGLLCQAVQKKNLTDLHAFLSLGMNPNETDVQGMAAVHHAAICCDRLVINKLLKFGADFINPRTPEGANPISVALKNRSFCTLSDILPTSVNGPIVRTGWSIRHIAEEIARNGEMELFDIYKERRGHFLVPTENGQLLSEIAAERKGEGLATKILKEEFEEALRTDNLEQLGRIAKHYHGRLSRVYFRDKSMLPTEALHYAAAKGCKKACQVLVELGKADPEKKDPQGLRAEDLASRFMHMRTADYLLKTRIRTKHMQEWQTAMDAIASRIGGLHLKEASLDL